MGELSEEHVDLVDICVVGLANANVLAPDALGPHVIVDLDCGFGKSDSGFVHTGLNIGIGVATVDVVGVAIIKAIVPRVVSLVIVVVVVPGDTVR